MSPKPWCQCPSNWDLKYKDHFSLLLLPAMERKQEEKAHNGWSERREIAPCFLAILPSLGSRRPILGEILRKIRKSAPYCLFISSQNNWQTLWGYQLKILHGYRVSQPLSDVLCATLEGSYPSLSLANVRRTIGSCFLHWQVMLGRMGHKAQRIHQKLCLLHPALKL